MKMSSIVSVLLCLVLSGSQVVMAQQNEKKEQVAQEVKRIIESKEYLIDVNRAIPMQGSSTNLTSLYALTIKNDSVSSYLPYFGRAYSAPYGGGKGLHFDAPMSAYALSFDKKGTAKIQFQVRTDEDRYTYTIQVYSNGSATIHVMPTNKQSIRFYGALNLTKQQQAE